MTSSLEFAGPVLWAKFFRKTLTKKSHISHMGVFSKWWSPPPKHVVLLLVSLQTNPENTLEKRGATHTYLTGLGGSPDLSFLVMFTPNE